MKVKGLYYGNRFTGTVRKSRCYYGNDHTLFDYLIYYIDLDEPIEDELGEKTSICIDGMSQKCGYTTVDKI